MAVDIAVGHMFGRHIVEVVGCLKAQPVFVEFAVGSQTDALGHTVELVERLLLELIAEPCRGVARFIGPRYGMHDRQFGNRFQLLHSLGRRPELNATLGGETRQSLEELEYPRRSGLQFAEGLEVHEQVDYLFLGRCRCDPVDIFVGSHGVAVPFGVREAEGDIVAQLRVLEQQFQLRARGGAVDVVGRFPAQNMLGALGYAPFETHVVDLRSEVVAVDELGVAQNFRLDAEQGMEFLTVGLDLQAEFLRVGKRRQRVGVGLGKELYLAGLGQLLQQVDEFGHILLELIQSRSCHRDSAAESAVGSLDHAQQALGGGYVGVGSYASDDIVVGEVVEIIMVVAYVEKAVAFEAERLMYLEIKTDCFHCCRVL